MLVAAIPAVLCLRMKLLINLLALGVLNAVAFNRRGADLVFSSESVGGFCREIILIPLLCCMLICACPSLRLLLRVIPLAPQIAGLVRVKVAAAC